MIDLGLEGEDSNQNSEMRSKAKSPCINVCQLNSDNMCLGCYRTLDEIGSWGSASNNAQLLIVEKALKRKANLSQ